MVRPRLEVVDEKYGRALIASDSITPEEEHELAVEMSELIGLPAEFIEGKHLRIELDIFRKTIMADEGLFTGRYDTRFTEPAYMVCKATTSSSPERIPPATPS